MERGRAMVERSTRYALVEKWLAEKRILVADPIDKEYDNVAHGLRPTLVSIGTQTFREPTEKFPSKKMIADVYLALEFNK
jgi:hypothetical protein